MPNEQEELRLTVTLVDNASAGLDKLQEKLKELRGGSGQQHIEKFKRDNAEITNTVKKMTGEFGEAFKSLGMLRLGFVGGVAGLAAFGFEMGRQIAQLGEFSDKLRAIARAGRTIGVDPGVIRNISEQLKVFGVSGDQALASISKFAERMSELQRDPAVRMGIMNQTSPAARADMEQRIAHLNQTVDIEDKLNQVRQLGESVYQNARRRGESEERAADERRRAMALFGYNDMLAYAGALKKRSDEEKAADEARYKNATTYSNALGKLTTEWDKFVEHLDTPLLGPNSPLIWTLTKAIELLEYFNRQATEQEGAIAKYEKGAEGKTPSLLERLNPNSQFRIDEEKRRQEAIEKLRQAHPETFGQPGASTFDRRFNALRPQEEQKKSLDLNTEALKKQTSLIESAIDAQGGTGGGIINAAYTTGGGFGGGYADGFRPGGGGAARGGGASSFGSAAFPNLGMAYGGDGGGRRRAGGGGAPNGSDVGAGSGAGAGETPAGDPSLHGNEYLASQRARLKKELDDNPELKRRFAAIIEKENPTAGAQVAESAMNRAAMTGRSMASILGGGSKSFYGPVRTGLIEPTMRNMSARTLAERYRQIEQGLAGGNTVRGATDQGSRGDPNYEAGGQAVPDVNRERFGYWGGYRGVAYSRRWAQAQQEQVNRQQLDRAQAAATKVEGTGKIRVDVNAPSGTNVSAEGGGLFKNIEMNRQTQMTPADTGPPAAFVMPPT